MFADRSRCAEANETTSTCGNQKKRKEKLKHGCCSCTNVLALETGDRPRDGSTTAWVRWESYPHPTVCVVGKVIVNQNCSWWEMRTQEPKYSSDEKEKDIRKRKIKREQILQNRNAFPFPAPSSLKVTLSPWPVGTHEYMRREWDLHVHCASRRFVAFYPLAQTKDESFYRRTHPDIGSRFISCANDSSSGARIRQGSVSKHARIIFVPRNFV
jgi:hypothetical protein